MQGTDRKEQDDCKAELEHGYLGKNIILSLSLSALTTEFGRPISVPFKIFSANGRTSRLHSFDKILEDEWRLEKFIRVDFCPGHFHGASVPWRTWREFLYAIILNLYHPLVCFFRSQMRIYGLDLENVGRGDRARRMRRLFVRTFL